MTQVEFVWILASLDELYGCDIVSEIPAARAPDGHCNHLAQHQASVLEIEMFICYREHKSLSLEESEKK